MTTQGCFLSLPDQIVRRLTDDILRGTYLPGQRLKEQELAQKLGTSRAPIREAFRMLERKGLIEVLPWRGVRVVELSRDEISDLFDARAHMFSFTAREAAVTATETQRKRIQSKINELVRRTNAGCDEREYKELTNDISSELYAMVRNRYLREFIENLRQKMLWHYCYMGISSYESRQEANRYWRDLSRALIRRDESAAGIAAHKIIAVSKALALTVLDANSPAGQNRESTVA